MMYIAPMECRFCLAKNPVIYYGPKPKDSTHKTYSCTCLDCAIAVGWVTKDGTTKKGVSF